MYENHSSRGKDYQRLCEYIGQEYLGYDDGIDKQGLIDIDRKLCEVLLLDESEYEKSNIPDYLKKEYYHSNLNLSGLYV